MIRPSQFLDRLAFSFLALTGFDVLCGVAKAQCTPAAYEKTFQKVYRQHKMFLEGVTDVNGAISAAHMGCPAHKSAAQIVVA